MKLIIFFCFLFITDCASSINNSEQIVSKLKKTEEKDYYNYLVKNKKYEKILDKTEAGDNVLIRNFCLFKPWTDASSLSLTYTLPRSLTKNAGTVFSVTPEYFSLQDICTIPCIEILVSIELEHIDKSIQALDKFLKHKTDPDISERMLFYKKLRKI